MKNLIFIFSLLIIPLSYGTNTLDCKEENQAINLCKKIESNFLKPKKASACEAVSSTTSTTNPDGSITTTTTATVTCDTPQELALFNSIIIAITEQ